MPNTREVFRNYRISAIIGGLLVLTGVGVLFWNEGRDSHTSSALHEAFSGAITVNPNREQPDNLEGRVLHFSGPLAIAEPIVEVDYNLQQYAVKLKRRVQMYQWVEDSVDNNADDTYGDSQRSYYYTKEWREDFIDSRLFHSPFSHENPPKKPIDSHTHVADSARIGLYELGDQAKSKFENFVAVASDTRPDDSAIKLHMGFYYHTNDVFNPSIGDVRILFMSAGLDGEVHTVVGMLKEGYIVPFVTTHKLPVLLAFPGELSLSEVFKLEHYAQRKTTWLYRGIGWFLTFFGIVAMPALLHSMLSRVEILCALAPNPQSPLGASIALSFSLALLVASVAWAVHRPMFSIGLLCAAMSPFLWFARTVASTI